MRFKTTHTQSKVGDSDYHIILKLSKLRNIKFRLKDVLNYELMKVF